jgi:sialate O-acetylesterase
MNRNPILLLVTVSAVLFCAPLAPAEVTLPKLFGDNMVLQRDRPVPVWGWAEKGTPVTVTFAGQEKRAVTDEEGKWRVNLDPMKACREPAVLKVTGTNEVVFKGVLVGEVWLCAGQSNMEMWLGQVPDIETEGDSEPHSLLRHVKLNNVESPVPLVDASNSTWAVCSSRETKSRVTAVGYFFAKELVKELGVPVGLINCSWGGTPIETWTAPAGFEAVGELQDIIPKYAIWDSKTDLGQKAYAEHLAKCRAWLNEAERALGAKKPVPPAPARFPPAAGQFPQMPTRLFNSMIHPLIPYGHRGVIWYQGESNADGGSGMTYLPKMRALVGGWRQLWQQGDFPFYFVQLPNFRKIEFGPNQPAGGDGWSILREAQRQSLAAIPNTGMAVTLDIGETQDPHPKNKRDVGLRLARWALARDYGKSIVYSGPLYKSFKVEGNKIRLFFDSVGSGLMVGRKTGREPAVEVNDGKLTWFAMADEVTVPPEGAGAAAGRKRVWHWAEAVIEGDTVVVSCDQVKQPVAVRYAYAMNPEGANLYNKDGLPASPFRTDDGAAARGK